MEVQPRTHTPPSVLYYSPAPNAPSCTGRSPAPMSLPRTLLFFVPMIALVVGVHVYLYRRLVRDLALSRRWRLAGAAAIAILGALVPGSFWILRLLRPDVAAPFAWASYVWIGLTMYLALFFGVTDAIRAVAFRVRGTGDPTRRAVLARGTAGVVGLLAGGVGAAGAAHALGRVPTKHVRVPIARLPAALRGLRIVQLTDVHIGPTIDRDFVRRLVEQTNALRPDVIALTGDLIDGTVAQLEDYVAPLADLRAEHGVFFVTGNHEYYWGAEEWLAHLSTLGIRALRNERATIFHRGALLDIAGVHDWSSARTRTNHRPDLARALAGRDPTRPVILLAHQPRAIDEAADRGVSLQLSGHTHGGQLFPWTYLVRLQQPYVSGLHDHRGTKIYVSMGTGYWGPPMRLGTTAEVTLIELV